eukprot:Blabericola_migrator_1__2599@NODE_1733_length_3904_cov_412_686734_g1120_i0_p4_GENE_NODE_1733_length_3904_cov_412_686734_g1120_i0NODE_1733_length_3904_cov_412_686734_g1120_i0_p4_ORF_typecomplete_len216_score36_12EMP24_GP25L/PF01105_24/1_4e19Gene66/PF02053_15/1_9e03Gene66/PF02053_15/0_11_NODE_1733_length_3904_cov_412_686734_g1120_i024603107
MFRFSLWIVISLLTHSVTCIRTILFPLEEQCISFTAPPKSEVIVNFEAHPKDESRVSAEVRRYVSDLDTPKELVKDELVRTAPPWHMGQLNLTLHVYESQQTKFSVCFKNIKNQRKTDLTFTIRADLYEHIHDIATQEHTAGMLKAVLDFTRETKKISEQQHFALAREEAQRKAIRDVHKGMVTWSIAQILFIAFLSGAQIYYVKRQFTGSSSML